MDEAATWNGQVIHPSFSRSINILCAIRSRSLLTVLMRRIFKRVHVYSSFLSFHSVLGLIQLYLLVVFHHSPTFFYSYFSPVFSSSVCIFSLFYFPVTLVCLSNIALGYLMSCWNLLSIFMVSWGWILMIHFGPKQVLYFTNYCTDWSRGWTLLIVPTPQPFL